MAAVVTPDLASHWLSRALWHAQPGSRIIILTLTFKQQHNIDMIVYSYEPQLLLPAVAVAAVVDAVVASCWGQHWLHHWIITAPASPMSWTIYNSELLILTSDDRWYVLLLQWLIIKKESLVIVVLLGQYCSIGIMQHNSFIIQQSLNVWPRQCDTVWWKHFYTTTFYSPSWSWCILSQILSCCLHHC